jgi:hypothetical protein
LVVGIVGTPPSSDAENARQVLILGRPHGRHRAIMTGSPGSDRRVPAGDNRATCAGLWGRLRSVTRPRFTHTLTSSDGPGLAFKLVVLPRRYPCSTRIVQRHPVPTSALGGVNA